MTDDNKPIAESKITKKGLLTMGIIMGVVLVLYFTVTVAPLSVFTYLDGAALNKGSINGPYKWWTIFFARLSSLDEPLNLRNIIIGIAGAVTLGFAWRRLIIADEQKEAQVKQADSHIRQTEFQVKQTEIESDGRVRARFDNTVDALSKKLDESSFPAHLWAISDLRTLATDSPEHTQRCLDIICNCNQWMEGYLDEFFERKKEEPYSSWLLNENNRIANKNIAGEITLLHEKRSQEALVAVRHILKDISTNNPEQLKELKFYNKMLCGISLSNLKLDGIDFQNVYLVSANLNKISLNKAKLKQANLNKAHLGRAQLQRASLDSAQLQETFLSKANLQGAYLYRANLQGASLHSANLQQTSLYRANLQRVCLDLANLGAASLGYTQLQEASLWEANLHGASLWKANLQKAILIHTKLPGAVISDADLSNAIFLGCNLYGATLKDIKCKNILFNEIAAIVYIKDKEERIEKRKEYLDYICHDMKLDDAKSFTQKMRAAWQAMDNFQEPDGLEMMRENSIVTKDNQGIYDISKDHLAGLQERFQKMFNKTDSGALYNIRYALDWLGMILGSHVGQTTGSLKESPPINRNFILVEKLLEVIPSFTGDIPDWDEYEEI